MANIPAPRGYFPPQTNLRVATPVGGQALPMNTNVGQPSPFFDMRPYQEFFGDPTRDLLASTRAAIASRTAQPTVTPQTRFTGQVAPASYMSPALSQMPSQQITPKTPSGLDQLRAAQLRMPAKGSPELAGLSAAAATGLQLSGYQDRPLTTGQIVGSMLGTYNEAQQAAAQRQADEQQQALANQLALAGFQLDVQKAMQVDPSRYRQMAIDAGYDPDTPEGIEYIKQLQKATGGTGVNISMDAGFEDFKRKKQYERGLQTVEKMMLSVQDADQTISNLEQMKSIILKGTPVGSISEATIPLRRFLSELNLLSADEVETLTDQMIYDKLAKEASLKVKPPASGSTSDFEAGLYLQVIAGMGGTADANLQRINVLMAMQEYNKKRTQAAERFFDKNETMLGFDEEWDRTGVKPFVEVVKTYNEAGEPTTEALWQAISNGDIKANDTYRTIDVNGVKRFDTLTKDRLDALRNYYGG